MGLAKLCLKISIQTKVIYSGVIPKRPKKYEKERVMGST